MTFPTFREALRFWLKLGFISFGGPAGQIAIMHHYLVDQKKWISESRFLHALNYCMLLPGPEAQQLAIYTGWLLHGVRGGIAAGILFFLPSMFILLGLSMAYVSFGHLPFVTALFVGLKPAVVAIIFHALFKIARKSLKTTIPYVIAVAAFIAIFFFDVPFPAIVLSSILIGVLFMLSGFSHWINDTTKTKSNVDESEYLINKMNVQHNDINPFGLFLKLLAGIGLWIIPVIFTVMCLSDLKFWMHLIYFFTKAALVTFGGAYAVLPYVAQVSVENFSWLSKLQMVDGLALGETTPGPLIMVLAFVGFMAGYNHFGSSLAMGSVGLFITTWYTFLPCFLFILLGAPVIERTRNMQQIKVVLGFVTAAITGVILNLALYFAQAVVFPLKNFNSPDLFALAWIVISFVLLIRFKLGIISLITLSALAGLIKFAIS